MNTLTRNIGRSMVTLCLGSAAFAAAPADDQEIALQFKARLGTALNGGMDNLAGRTMGVGLDLVYPTSIGRFGLELGYQYKPGNQYSYDVSKAPVEPGATVDPVNSKDLRRNSLEGIAARVSYVREFADPDFAYQFGLQIGGARFRHEYFGNVSVDGVTDAYVGTRTKSALALSPYAGVVFKLSPTTAFEVNVVFVGYTAVDYVHTAGTGETSGVNVSKDRFAEKSRYAPHIEIGYAFRF